MRESVCMWVRVCAWVSEWVNVCIYMSECVSVYECVRVYGYVCEWVCACVWVSVCECMSEWVSDMHTSYQSSASHAPMPRPMLFQQRQGEQTWGWVEVAPWSVAADWLCNSRFGLNYPLIKPITVKWCVTAGNAKIKMQIAGHDFNHEKNCYVIRGHVLQIYDKPTPTFLVWLLYNIFLYIDKKLWALYHLFNSCVLVCIKITIEMDIFCTQTS